MVKLEQENDALRSAVYKLSARIPTEILSDCSGGSELFEECPDGIVTNTRNFQIDTMFAANYYFMSNVRNDL